MTAKLFTLPKQVPLTNSGALMPGAKAYFFEAGTSTPLTVYTDHTLVTPHTDPVVADGDGRFPAIYYGLSDYKIKITDASDVEQYTQDYAASLISQQEVGAALWPQTDVEAGIPIVPDDYGWPSGRPWRYGQGGTSSVYATGLTADMGKHGYTLYNGTLQTGPGFAGYNLRVQTQTEDAVDVASTVGLASILQSYSTNSGGTATDNNTNQVAFIANASAMDATASASVVSANIIGASLYTGGGTQTLNPFQVGINNDGNDAGWFGDAGKIYSPAATILNYSSTKDSSAGLIIDTSQAGVGFLHGCIISCATKTGITVAANTVLPEVGLWVNAASSFGVYIGAKPLYTTNAGYTPVYATDSPSIGICLGHIAAASGRSNKLRFSATHSDTTEYAWDIYSTGSSASALTFQFSGATKLIVASTGFLTVAGNQVLAGRATGWGAPTGSPVRTTFDTTTVTTEQLAQRVHALIDDLTAHGMIGA